MKNLRQLTLFIFLLALTGCENDRIVTKTEDFGELRLDEEEQALIMEPPGEIPEQEQQIDRKFIKNGELEFETENLNETQENIFEALKKFDGYIASENVYKNSYEVSSNMVIRVPAENFDNLINEIAEGVERFDRKEIYVQDVTEEYLDIEARLKTKKELENRYLEILEKANSVSEILEVEKQIGQLRAEIESIEGRLKFLNSQVSLSTLTVRIYEPVSEHNEFGEMFGNGFKNGWENLILFFVFLVNIWPFILIIFAVLIFFRIRRKRRRTVK